MQIHLDVVDRERRMGVGVDCIDVAVVVDPAVMCFFWWICLVLLLVCLFWPLLLLSLMGEEGELHQ